MILTQEQAILAITTFYDARLAGAESRISFPNKTAVDTGSTITIRQDSFSEVCDGPLDMAEAYGLYIVEARFSENQSRTFVVPENITAERFAALFEGRRLREFRIVR